MPTNRPSKSPSLSNGVDSKANFEAADVYYEDEILWGDDPNQNYFEYFMENEKKDGTEDSTLGEVLAAPSHVLLQSHWNQVAESTASASIEGGGGSLQPSIPSVMSGSSGLSPVPLVAPDDEEKPSPAQKEQARAPPPTKSPPPAGIGFLPMGNATGPARQADVPSVIYVGSTTKNIVRRGDTDISYQGSSTFTTGRHGKMICLLLAVLVLCVLAFGALALTIVLRNTKSDSGSSQLQQADALDPQGPDTVTVPNPTSITTFPPIPGFISAPSISPTSAPIQDSGNDPVAPPASSPVLQSTNSPIAAPVPQPLPTLAPSLSPVLVTLSPVIPPVASPIAPPVESPPASPLASPVFTPVAPPTDAPVTKAPSASPTIHPSVSPTALPSSSPSKRPTPLPSRSPTDSQTGIGSGVPSISRNPTPFPTTLAPTMKPTLSPTIQPTVFPTLTATNSPTSGPTIDPELTAFFAGLSSHDDGEALRNPFSPQFKALQWLTEDPQLESYPGFKKMQRFVMATLYFSTNGYSWRKDNGWLSNEDECDWFSSAKNSCDENGRLRELDLRDNQLEGTLPVELSWLQSLLRLNLRDANIGGTIPPQFGNLNLMRYFQMTRNDLTGTLPPELASWTNLEVMGLGRNTMTGTIPTEYAALTSLNTWGLERNDFRGSIASEYGAMTSLKILALDDNSLTGTIPSELGNLFLLTNLNLNDNQISGVLPDEVCALASAPYVKADCWEIVCNCCSECCNMRGDGSNCQATR